VWDEERQDWIPRWGWKGKNKDEESQWLHEVPANAGVSTANIYVSNCRTQFIFSYDQLSDTNYDPSKEARVARKARVAKNENQRLQNLARAQQGVTVNSGAHADRKKKEIERSLVMTRASTASMGRFDRMLPGEKKPRGLKRKVPVIHILFFFCVL
jgi:regulator of ribosome biosynthesis